MNFDVRYFDPLRNAVVADRVAADSEAALRMDLGASGRVVLAVSRLRTGWSAGSHARAKLDIGVWCRELRTLVNAGMTVVEALETLQAQSVAERGSRRHAIQADLLHALHDGKSLSQAMQDCGAFPDVLVASVKASERTSTLTNALDDFVRYDQTLLRLKREVTSAAIYPAVVFGLGTAIVLFLLLYVVPRFARMYSGTRADLSPVTQALLGVSHLLAAYTEAALAGFFALGLTIAWAAHVGLLKRWLSSLAGRIGPLRRQWNEFLLAKLYQSLALMTRGGYTLDEALLVCGGLGLGRNLSQGLEEARQELRQGRSIGVAFGQAGLTDSISKRLLTVGERSGGFEAVLQTIADRHAEAFTTFVERATRIVEPVLLLCVALVVGGVVLMMYMPIFDIASSVR